MIKAKYYNSDYKKLNCVVLEDLGEYVKIKSEIGNIYTIKKEALRDIDEGFTIWNFLGLGIILFILAMILPKIYFIISNFYDKNIL